MRYNQIINEAVQTFYHGSTHQIKEFNLENVGREGAIDQEGPGIYLTSSPDDARHYGEHIHVVQVKIVKSRMMPDKRTINPQFIRGLITKAPDVDDNLTNYAENREVAIRTAVQQIMDAFGPNEYREAMEQVWYDHYRGQEREWLSRMRSVGWDGFLVPRSGGVVHLICFNPEILKITGEL